MDRKAIKTDTKNLLNENYSYFIKLFLISFILIFITYFPNIYFAGTYDLDTWSWTSYDSVSSLSAALLAIFVVSAQFTGVDILRDKSKLTTPFQRCLTIFENGQLFLGTIIIYLLAYIWIFLWTLLFIFPGIIKALAYSQSLFIYRDRLLKNDPIKYTEAVTLSRELMVGHKWEFFVFQLSFIGYWLLTIVTFGVAGIWVIPYYRLSTANYYVHLTQF